MYATYFGFVTAYSNGCGPSPNMMDTLVLNYPRQASLREVGKRSTVTKARQAVYV
jgi:hypothetical protein